MRALMPLLAVTLSCGTPPLLPLPRIEFSPGLLCEGDASTLVRIDGGKSFAPATEEQGPELDLRWSFAPEPVEVRQGTARSTRMLVRFSAEEPVRIDLEVVDEDGNVGLRSRVLGMTTRAGRACSLGCWEDERCVEDDGRELCAPADTCLDTSECGCWECRDDGTGTQRCLPRRPS